MFGDDLIKLGVVVILVSVELLIVTLVLHVLSGKKLGRVLNEEYGPKRH